MLSCVVACIVLGLASLANAADEAPEAFIKRLSGELQEVVKNDPALKSGDLQKTRVVVDTRIMPHLNFQRMTASAVGPAWRTATPEQQTKLANEFKTLLVRTYAGALSQVTDITINVKPMGKYIWISNYNTSAPNSTRFPDSAGMVPTETMQAYGD